jgi:nucleoside-diphosphate-sugar epimerase
MQVLVIGGSRFIGLAIVQRLINEGHRITLLNRGRDPDPFGTRVNRVLGDRTDPETLERAVARRDFDAVVDIVAYREDDTRTAIEKLAGRIGHFVHISTVSVYLIRDGLYCPFREEDAQGRLAPKTAAAASSWSYAYHKRRCEQVLAAAWQERQFAFTSLRLPMVVGPGDYTERALAYLERLDDRGPLILPDGGLNSWGFLAVSDVAEVVAANLMNSNAFGRAYNLAQREVVSLREFVVSAAAAMGRKPTLVPAPSEWLHRLQLGVAFSPYSYERDVVLDTAAAERDLLFEPTPFATWCQALVEDFRSTWDGTHSPFYATRRLELRLVREMTQLKIPDLTPAAAARR